MSLRPSILISFALILSGAFSTTLAQSRGVQTVSDIAYADTPNARQTLDLMLPATRATEQLPVVVFIHGGGWRSGSKERGKQRLMPLVTTGNYIGVSVGYRLTDEAQWPSQIHDCKAAIRWIRANASAYGMDPEQIGVFGTSAGGHLVAVLGTSGEVSAMEGSVGTHPKYSSKVTCVIDLYGPTNFLTMNESAVAGAKLDHDAPSSPESLLIGGPIQEHPAKVATANPMTYVSSDDPPFLIIHGTEDPLVSFDQSEILHSTLKAAGVDSTLVTIRGGGHGKGFPDSTKNLMERFFDHHLRGKLSDWSDHEISATPWRKTR